MNLPRIKWMMYLSHPSKDIPHSHFNDVLGLTATRTWNMEDTMHLPPELRHSGWRYSIEEFEVYSINEVFTKLVGILMPSLAELKSLVKEYGLEIQFVCVIEANDGDTPEVALDVESIAFLAELGARLGFDLYYYPQEDEDDKETV